MRQTHLRSEIEMQMHLQMATNLRLGFDLQTQMHLGFGMQNYLRLVKVKPKATVNLKHSHLAIEILTLRQKDFEMQTEKLMHWQTQTDWYLPKPKRSVTTMLMVTMIYLQMHLDFDLRRQTHLVKVTHSAIVRLMHSRLAIEMLTQMQKDSKMHLVTEMLKHWHLDFDLLMQMHLDFGTLMVIEKHLQMHSDFVMHSHWHLVIEKHSDLPMLMLMRKEMYSQMQTQKVTN